MSITNNLIQTLFQSYQRGISPSISEIQMLRSQIHDEPMADWDNAQANSLKGKFLMSFIDKIRENEDIRNEFSHLSYLYFSRALELLKVHNNLKHLIPSNQIKIQLASSLMEIYRDRLALLHDYSSLFHDTIINLAGKRRNPLTASYRSNFNKEAPRLIDTMIFDDMDRFRDNMILLQEYGSNLPSSVNQILQLSHSFLSKGLTKE